MGKNILLLVLILVREKTRRNLLLSDVLFTNPYKFAFKFRYVLSDTLFYVFYILLTLNIVTLQGHAQEICTQTYDTERVNRLVLK